MTPPTSDLFLSYNRQDQQSVFEVQRLLQLRGIRTFLDRDNLVAGLSWPQMLEDGLRSARAVAVFLGPQGLGLWQKREMYFALDRQAQAEREGSRFPVIPVLLLGADLPTGFLFLNTWIDLRPGVDEGALDSLINAVAGDAHLGNVPEASAICPYRGLRAFREEDAAFYFGREAFSKELFNKIASLQKALDGPAVVAVVGPSGSGKSSVVQAGLLPMLRRQRPPNVTWDAVIFTPGEHPWRRMADALIPLLDPDLSEAKRLEETDVLARVLAQGSAAVQSVARRILSKSEGTDRLLIVVDQFEELFTLTPEQERGAFIESLVDACRRSPVTVVVTLRGDFYGRAVDANRAFSDALAAGQVNLGPMTGEELREVIQQPALRVGLALEAGLADRILEDVIQEPGNLPLLEYALTELWNLRDGNELSLDGYERSGRVARSIATRAETLYAGLNNDQQRVAHRLFTRLVRVARGGEEGSDTRRRVRRDELGKEEWAIVELFADPQTRLLVASRDPRTKEDTVEVAHEALIRHWKRLRDWVDDDREFLLGRQELAVYLATYIASGKKDLLHGEMLQRARGWSRNKSEELNAAEKELIKSSDAATKSPLKWAAASVGALLLILAVFAGWTMFVRTNDYQVKAILETSPGLVDKSLLDNPPELPYIWMRVMALTGHDEKALAAAHAISDPERQSTALYDIAVALAKIKRRDDAERVAGEALNSARKIEKPEESLIFDVFRSAAKNLSEAGVTSGAQEAADEALKIVSTTNSGQEFSQLAPVLIKMGRGGKLFAFAEKSDPAQQASYYISISKACVNDRAIDHAKQATVEAQRANDQAPDPAVLLRMAKDAIVKAREANERTPDTGTRVLNMIDVATALADIDNVDEALALTHKASEQLRRSPSKSNEATGWGEIDPAPAYNAVARSLAWQGKLDEAFALIRTNNTPRKLPGAFASVAGDLAERDMNGAKRAAQESLTALANVSPDADTGLAKLAKAALFQKEVLHFLCNKGLIDDALNEAGKLASESPSEGDQVYYLIATTLAEKGLLNEAQAVADKVTGSTWSRTKIYSYLARRLVSAGRVDEAKRAADEALNLARQAEEGRERIYSRTLVAPILAMVGNIDEATKVAEEAMQLAEKIDDPAGRSEAVAAVAWALARIGHYYKAVDAVDTFTSPFNKLRAYTAVLIHYNKRRDVQLTQLLELEDERLGTDELAGGFR